MWMYGKINRHGCNNLPYGDFLKKIGAMERETMLFLQTLDGGVSNALAGVFTV